MDIISHFLTTNLVYKILSKRTKDLKIIPFLIAGSIPDIGEILIQIKLSNKYGTYYGVYDVRTSDSSIASELSITWLYDLLHSPILFISLFIISRFLSLKNSQIFKSIGIGLFLHFLLDFCTHGSVWALKLFFPFSNNRYPILEKSIGNWWDWTPKVDLPFVLYGFPLFNIIYIFVITLITINLKKWNRK